MQQEMNKSDSHLAYTNSMCALHTEKPIHQWSKALWSMFMVQQWKLRDVAAITTCSYNSNQPWDKSSAGPIEKALIDAKRDNAIIQVS